MVLRAEAHQRIASVAFDFEAVPKRSVAACNLCGATEFAQVASHDRYGYPARSQMCVRCGLVFLDPMPTAEAYGAFYREVYRPLVSAYHGRRIDAASIEADQLLYAEELIDTLAPHVEARAPSTLLDVGGSTGVVAEAVARRFSLSAAVLEPAPAEAARAAARGLETIVGTIEDYAPDGRRFDLVLLCQTIDHLLDVSASLAKIRALLSDGGLLFVDVVDFLVTAERAGRVEEAIKVDHPYSLTPATAEAFLARAGLRPLATIRARDGLHVGFVCEPATPLPDALPPAEALARLRGPILRP